MLSLPKKLTMVQYSVKPERTADNIELIRGVYAQLCDVKPSGLRYATLHDGAARFVHLAIVTPGAEPHPLLSQPAFQRFAADIADRCILPPETFELEAVGSYRFLDSFIERFPGK
jgi:hypothetical protein